MLAEFANAIDVAGADCRTVTAFGAVGVILTLRRALSQARRLVAGEGLEPSSRDYVCRRSIKRSLSINHLMRAAGCDPYLSITNIGNG